MTLNQLHKRLGALIEQGCGRHRVAIDKASFVDNRESDGCTILPVMAIEDVWIPDADDDGGTAVNKDGTERGRCTVVLGGCMYDRKESREIP